MAKIPYITLSDTINTSRLRINQLIDSVGDLSLLTTGDSATIVGAINFLDSNAGRKTALTTTIKTSIVAGVNELDAELGTITAAAMKSRLGASTVSAVIAEIHDSIGSGSLTTTTKTLVGAINEHDTELGTITSAAMKTKLGAATVSGALAAISDSIGSGSLTTTTKTLVGAINTLDAELGTITSAAMKTKLGAATVSAAIAELNDSIGYGLLTTSNKQLIAAINELDSNAGRKVNLKTTTRTSLLAGINEIQDSIGYGGLNTTTKTLVGAINEHDAELGTITAAAMKTKLSASTVSTAIAGINDSIGYGILKTDAKTVIGAINEIQDSIGYGGLNTTSKTLVGAINELQDSIGSGGVNTTAKTLIGAINEIEDSIGRGGLTTVPKNLVGAVNFLDSNAGRKANLTTLITSNLVNAINFVDSNAGRKANLTTSVKTSLAAAINSVKDSSAAVTGPLGSLTTTVASNLVGAVNFLDSNAGRKANLTTTSKTNLVSAINEHDTELGTITTAAMKVKGTASTVSGALAAISDSIGSGTLTTTPKTLVGAINALDAELGTITAAAMKTKLGATTVSGALAAISDSIGSGSLTTSSKNLVGAINELKTRQDTTQSHVVDSASQLLLKSNGQLSARFTNANVQFQGFVTSTTALDTTQQDYTGAINELKNTIDLITGAVSVDSGISNTVGSLSNLSTPITSTIVAAINFLDSNAGDKTSLNTTNKTSLVAGINELDARLDSINAAGISNTMIKSDAVITSKILNNNVTFAKLPLATTAKRVIASTAAGAIYSEQQVDSDMIGSLAIPAAKIQSNAITTVKIIDSAVSTSKIQLNAVTTAKILDLNVTSGKLANNAVTYAKMQTNSTANRVIGATSAGSQLGEVQIQSAMIAAGAVDSAALKANTVTLGTKTTGPYVASLVQGTGVTLTNNSGAGSTPTIAIGQAVGTTSNVTFNDVIVSGNLTVSGTTTSINTETITLNDNIIVLNNNATGAASQDAGIEIERGTDSNVSILWNETTNRWTFTNSGTTLGPFYNIPTPNEYIDSATSKFPTTYAWTAGTTSGPTGSLTGNNLTAISFPAIPSAGASASGIITTGAQTIAGAKTFSSTITGSIDGNAGTVTNGFYTTSSFNLGTTSIAVNRASGAQTLTGVSIDGNAGTATSVATLTTGRNFSITGAVTAPAISFNGGANVALATTFTTGSVDSAALGALSVSTAKIQASAVTAAKLASSVTLVIYNSAGTAVKTLYGAGA